MREFANRYPGRCDACRERVAKGAGHVSTEGHRATTAPGARDKIRRPKVRYIPTWLLLCARCAGPERMARLED